MWYQQTCSDFIDFSGWVAFVYDSGLFCWNAEKQKLIETFSTRWVEGFGQRVVSFLSFMNPFSLHVKWSKTFLSSCQQLASDEICALQKSRLKQALILST